MKVRVLMINVKVLLEQESIDLVKISAELCSYTLPLRQSFLWLNITNKHVVL